MSPLPAVSDDWSPDGRAVLETSRLAIAVLNPHPMWLAITGEVVLRRSRAGLPTDILDLTDVPLFDSDIDSHGRRLDRMGRPLKQDPLSRTRRRIDELAGAGLITWLSVTSPEPGVAGHHLGRDEARIGALNVTSEALSLAQTKEWESVLPPQTVDLMKRSWEQVFAAAWKALNERCPSALLLFNGRFVSEGAARAAALSLGVPTFGFDQGCRPDSVSVFRNHIHDRHAAVDDINHWWTRGADPVREATARRWFDSRIGRPGGGDNSHSAGFVSGVVPRADGCSLLVSVFTSSSDEFSSIDTDGDATPANQESWIEELITLAAGRSDIDLRFRVHPHTSAKDPAEQQLWAGLEARRSPNVTVYGPDSGVNSYALVATSDLVLTFGSTVTAEAAYMGVPVMELCENIWSVMGVARSVRDLAGLEPYLNDPRSAKLDGQAGEALKYAYWVQYSGNPLRFAHIEGVDASLGGRALEPFGSPFRGARRLYWRLGRSGRLGILESRHGLAGRHGRARHG